MINIAGGVFLGIAAVWALPLVIAAPFWIIGILGMFFKACFIGEKSK